MSKMFAPVNVKEASIGVQVYRAKTGQWEDHGVVAFYSRSPWRRWLFRIKQTFRKALPWRR